MSNLFDDYIEIISLKAHVDQYLKDDICVPYHYRNYMFKFSKNSEFLYLHVYDKENRNYDNRITKFFPLHHFTHSNVIAFLDFAIQILEDRQKNIV
jgi:hypothetical protein